MSNKVISFSLYGKDPDYHRGAIGNLAASKEVYPGWTCRFYVSQEIPQSVINELQDCGAEVIFKTRLSDADGMFWRFLPAGDENIDVAIVRDVDAILTLREKCAVDEWLASGKAFHIIRDSPGHDSLIMGGLWGCRPGRLPLIAQLIDEWPDVGYGGDQRFLNQHVYPRIEDDVLIHTDFNAFVNETTTPFPSPRNVAEWVGMPIFRGEQLKQRQRVFSRTCQIGFRVLSSPGQWKQSHHPLLRLVRRLPLAIKVIRLMRCTNSCLARIFVRQQGLRQRTKLLQECTRTGVADS